MHSHRNPSRKIKVATCNNLLTVKWAFCVWSGDFWGCVVSVSFLRPGIIYSSYLCFFFRSTDFLSKVYELFPKHEFIIITVPHLVPEFPLLQQFVVGWIVTLLNKTIWTANGNIWMHLRITQYINSIQGWYLNTFSCDYKCVSGIAQMVVFAEELSCTSFKVDIIALCAELFLHIASNIFTDRSYLYSMHRKSQAFLCCLCCEMFFFFLLNMSCIIPALQKEENRFTHVWVKKWNSPWATA